MDLTIVEIIITLLTFSVGGLVKWVWSIQGKVHSTQVDLAKNYHSKDELRQTMADVVRPLQDEVHRLAKMLDRLFEKD